MTARKKNSPLGTGSQERSVLVGKFFHSFGTDDGEKCVEWQGQVIGHVLGDVFLVATFSWFCGQETEEVLVHLRDMMGWMFYETAELMRFSYEHGSASRFSAENRRKCRKARDSMEKPRPLQSLPFGRPSEIPGQEEEEKSDDDGDE